MPGPKPHAPFKASRAPLPGQSFRFGEARRPISGEVAGSWRSMPSFGARATCGKRARPSTAAFPARQRPTLEMTRRARALP